MQSPSGSQSHAAPGSGAETLRFVHPTPPAPGHTIEIAPGILWARLALAVPARSREHLFRRRRQGMGADRHRARRQGDVGGLGAAARHGAERPPAHPHHRDALSSRPCRRGGLLAQAVQRAALHVGHRISAVPEFASRSGRARSRRTIAASISITGWMPTRRNASSPAVMPISSCSRACRRPITAWSPAIRCASAAANSTS